MLKVLVNLETHQSILLEYIYRKVNNTLSPDDLVDTINNHAKLQLT